MSDDCKHCDEEYQRLMSTHLKKTRENLIEIGIDRNDLVTIDNAISWISKVESYPKPRVSYSRYTPMPREVI